MRRKDSLPPPLSPQACARSAPPRASSSRASPPRSSRSSPRSAPPSPPTHNRSSAARCGLCGHGHTCPADGYGRSRARYLPPGPPDRPSTRDPARSRRCPPAPSPPRLPTTTAPSAAPSTPSGAAPLPHMPPQAAFQFSAPAHPASHCHASPTRRHVRPQKPIHRERALRAAEADPDADVRGLARACLSLHSGLAARAPAFPLTFSLASRSAALRGTVRRRPRVSQRASRRRCAPAGHSAAPPLDRCSVPAEAGAGGAAAG